MDLSDRIALQARTKAQIRAFFDARDVIEVTVPSVMPAPVTDPYIDVPRAQGPDGLHLGYLQSSPEYAMKRLLAQGSGDIFTITPAWRIDEIGPRHRMEFTLLEYYREGFTGAQLRAEVSQLMQALLNCPSATQISYRDAFIRELGWCPFEAPDPVVFEALRRELNYTGEISRTGALQWLCAVSVEPQLGHEAPCFLTHYPAEQAALARHVRHQGQACADRFELFYRGVELGNGYWELTDPKEQRARFEADLAQRAQQGLPTVPIDEALLASLADMPECSGIALGLDRIWMLAAGVDELSQVSLF